MGPDVKALISQMNARKIRSPQDVLDRIEWKTTGRAELLGYETKWKDALARYLFGTGVIVHASIDRSLLTQAELDVDPHDSLFRGEHFLEHVTGVRLLPQVGENVIVSALGFSG